MNARRSGHRVLLPAIGLAALLVITGLSRPQDPQPPKPARESSSVRGPSAADAAPAPERLTSKPCPDAVAAPTLKVGDAIETGSGQRRRVMIEWGAHIYMNENTKIKRNKADELSLSKGEVYV